MHDLNVLKEKLVECASRFDSDELFPALVPEALELVLADPYAFAIAACLDRGMKADVIWTLPYYIKSHLGHLDPHRIHQMSSQEIADVFAALPRRPRFVNDAPKTLADLTHIVVEECEGNAANLWIGKSALEAKHTFMRIHGVGNGIANMTVLLIEKAFPIRFDDADRRTMDIKPDVHTRRVLYRLGVAHANDDHAAIDAARRVSPDYPGAIDGGLWFIGRTWCSESNPLCSECCVSSLCERRGVIESR